MFGRSMTCKAINDVTTTHHSNISMMWWSVSGSVYMRAEEGLGVWHHQIPTHRATTLELSCQHSVYEPTTETNEQRDDQNYWE